MAECIKLFDRCPHLYRSNGREERMITLTGTVIRMKSGCYYCTVHPDVRKIGTHETWSGLTPYWCPLNSEEKEE